MIKLKFKNKQDELKFFVLIRSIENIYDVKIRYAELINDLDVADFEKDDKDD